MAMKIYKYPLKGFDRQEVSLPYVRQVLHFGFQNQFPFIWVLVDPDSVGVLDDPITFQIVATGETIPEGAEWFGTAQVGAFVWHLVYFRKRAPS